MLFIEQMTPDLSTLPFLVTLPPTSPLCSPSLWTSVSRYILTHILCNCFIKFSWGDTKEVQLPQMGTKNKLKSDFTEVQLGETKEFIGRSKRT